jgi:ferrous iron transport protein A
MRYAPVAMHQLTLQQLSVGERARVTGYARGDRSLRDRLLSFGLTRGATVEVVRTAPAGCPVELRVRDMSIVLRRSEAAGLHVERER